MQRLRFYDIRQSRLPSLLGLCTDNSPKIAEYVNTAQRRLLYCKEAGNEGWFGTWAEVLFNISRTSPYLTLPRDMARIEAVTVCNRVIPVQNQFYEYLQFGNGRLPKNTPCNQPFITQAYSRNNVPTFTDMTSAPQYLVAYITDSQDIGKTIVFQGTDQNSNTIYSQSDDGQVMGQILDLNTPLVATPQTFKSVTGIQKDQTVGVVRIYQRDPSTGDEVLLLTMEPSETTASYRRYYYNNLPNNCCALPGEPVPVQVTAIVKMELIPVQYDTDYLLIQNLEAIIEEAQAVRYSEIDNPDAKRMEAAKHKTAVDFLNGELNHYLGMNQAAVQMRPFGSARLERVRIGMQ